VTLTSDRTDQVELLTEALIMLGAAMTAGVKRNPDVDPPAFFVEMTGADVLDAASELLSIVVGTERTSQILVRVQGQIQKAQRLLDKMREDGTLGIEFDDDSEDWAT